MPCIGQAAVGFNHWASEWSNSVDHPSTYPDIDILNTSDGHWPGGHVLSTSQHPKNAGSFLLDTDCETILLEMSCFIEIKRAANLRLTSRGPSCWSSSPREEEQQERHAHAQKISSKDIGRYDAEAANLWATCAAFSPQRTSYTFVPNMDESALHGGRCHVTQLYRTQLCTCLCVLRSRMAGFSQYGSASSWKRQPARAEASHACCLQCTTDKVSEFEYAPRVHPLTVASVSPRCLHMPQATVCSAMPGFKRIVHCHKCA